MSWWHYVLMSWWHYVQVWKVRGPTLDTRCEPTASRDPVPRPKMEKKDVPLFSVGDMVAGPDLSHHPPSCIMPHVSWDQWWKEWRRSKSKNDQTQVFLACSDIYTRWFVNLRLSGGVLREGLCTCPWSPTWLASASTKPNTDNPDLTPATRSSPSVKLINLWLFPDRRTCPVKPATPEKPSETLSAARWNFRFEVSKKRLHFVKSLTAVDETAPLRTNIYICIEGWKYCQNAFPWHHDRQMREGERQRVRVDVDECNRGICSATTQFTFCSFCY